MDRALLERHLVQAELHVTQGEHHVARQREIIAGLANDGRGLRSAQALLSEFQRMLVLHIAHRDLVRTELAALAF